MRAQQKRTPIKKGGPRGAPHRSHPITPHNPHDRSSKLSASDGRSPARPLRLGIEIIQLTGLKFDVLAENISKSVDIPQSVDNLIVYTGTIGR
jgi:hypothetical protein